VTAPQELVERALELSTADGCVALVEHSTQANIRWAANTLTTNGVTQGSRVIVVSTVNGGKGTAAGVVARAATSNEAVAEIVRESEAAARANSAAEDAAPLLTPADLPVAESANWAEPPSESSFTVFSNFTPGLGSSLEAARADDRVLAGFAQHELSTLFLGTSTGLRLRHEQPTGKVELTARSPDGERSAWIGASSRDFADVDARALDAHVQQRLEWAKRRVDLPPDRYETILPPTAVADLLVYMYWNTGGRDAHDGRTVFSRAGGGTRVGDVLTPVPITLRSDPAAAGLACAPFIAAATSTSDQSVFDNGLPTQPTRWIDEGRLAALITTRHSAEITGLPVTPAVDNLILDGTPGGPDLAALVASTKRALLVTCLWYIREVDPQTLLLTGLTRDGVFLVEDGEVVGAVNNFRFNESPVDLLTRVTEIGATVPALPREWSDYFTRAAMPPLRVADFNMSSVSQAM
jgi:predicted Zn-dependent protease